MTTAARLVLADCEAALAEIVDGIQGSAWRRRWIAVIVLLRAVGHVVENVDSERSPEYKKAIAGAKASLLKAKPLPEIYWDFILKERNSLVKEYRTSAGQGVTVRPGGITLDLRTGEQWTSGSLPTLYHYIINDGPFRGRDQREVVREAIVWWKNHLDEIDKLAVAAKAEQAVAADRPKTGAG